MNMGSRITQRLVELGWTQSDLLDRVDGLEKGTLSRDSQRSIWSEPIANALGVHHAWLTRGTPPKESEASTSRSQKNSVAWHPVIAWDVPSDLPDNEFALVERRAVRLSAGSGTIVFEEEELPPLSFRADFLRSRRVTRKANLVIVYAEGDSMMPTIADGDSVLCDRGQTEIIDGEIYAIDYAGSLRVKRLRKRFDGGLIIISDNTLKHPSESLSSEDARHITVLGRVLWRGGSV